MAGLGKLHCAAATVSTGSKGPERPFPTWTAVGVTWLAGFDLEIKVIACIPAA